MSIVYNAEYYSHPLIALTLDEIQNQIDQGAKGATAIEWAIIARSRQSGENWVTSAEDEDLATVFSDQNWGASAYVDLSDGRSATLVLADGEDDPTVDDDRPLEDYTEIEWSDRSVVTVDPPEAWEALERPEAFAALAEAALRGIADADERHTRAVARAVRELVAAHEALGDDVIEAAEEIVRERMPRAPRKDVDDVMLCWFARAVSQGLEGEAAIQAALAKRAEWAPLRPPLTVRTPSLDREFLYGIAPLPVAARAVLLGPCDGDPYDRHDWAQIVMQIVRAYDALDERTIDRAYD